VKILDRYIIKEFAAPLLFGLVLFLFALIMDRLFDLMDLIFNRGVSPFTVGFLLMCLLPSIIAMTLPMATLLASLMAMGRLAQDRELMAMKSAGISLVRLAAPVAGVGAVASILLLIFNGTVLPESNAMYKKMFFEIVKKRATIAFKERVFVREFDQYLLYFNRKEGNEGDLRDMCILDLSIRPPRFITAKRGRLVVDQAAMKVKLNLQDGVVDQPLDRKGDQYSRIKFAVYELALDIKQAFGGAGLFVKGISEMNYADLLRAMGDQTQSKSDRRSYEVEFNQRIALAFAPLFCVLIGIPLGALARRGGGVGMVLSLAVIFVYYLMLTLAQGMAEGGKLPVWLALWIPNVFMAGAGGLAFLAAARESQWSRRGR